MFLWWGDDMIQFYNDAYRPSLGDNGKHPRALGQKAIDCWPEIWSIIFPLINQVRTTGEATWSEDQLIPIFRNGKIEDVYWTFGYSPVRNTSGEIEGILVICTETTARMQAEHDYRRIQQQILESFEESPVGIATLQSRELVFTMANPFYSELVGRPVSELIGKTLFEALPEIEGQGFDLLLLEVIDTGIAYTAKEVAVDLMRNGVMETIYVDLAYQPKRDAGQSVTGVLVVATDVTQQVRSRLKVEQSEAKMRALIQAAPAGIGLFVGRDLIVQMPNQTFIDIVGKGWDIVGKPLREVMPELKSEGQPFLDILDRVYTSGEMFQSFGSQVKIVREGRMTYNYYNITYTPIRDESGEVYAILDIAIDVTDAVLAMKKATEAETALLGAIELAKLATWRLDIKNNVFHYSSRFMDWLGFSIDMKDAAAAYDPVPVEFRKYVVEGIAEAIRPGGSGRYEAEHPIVNSKTGQKRIIHAQAQVFYDIDGNPEYLTGTAEDVTKERKLQQELEWLVGERTEKLSQANSDLQKSNAELEQFAYIASHDLQEPLRKISIFVNMLGTHLIQKDEKTLHYIERINSSAERMSNLVTDILGFSRLSHTEQFFEPVDLELVLEEILADFEIIVEQKRAKIESRGLPVIEAVPIQIEQLLGNIISNSLKYVAKDVAPEISIVAKLMDAAEKANRNLSVHRQYYKITFQDNGIGFLPEYSEQIFHIFQRLHGKSDFEGTGIGLAMCRKIVQNHQGIIEARSESGKGAVFTVILPENQQ